ncbi:MAG: sulfurtransferase TusA family protein [Candidatus Methanomethyliaceae archaeon]|nr:sulfurtransferase TusA family protein [Candidatus Methanomethyliaceae archaeon]
MQIELDLRGLYCPMPVLRTREEVAKANIGDLIIVIADDPAAEEDLKRWAKRAGHEVVNVKREGDAVSVSIKKLV